MGKIAARVFVKLLEGPADEDCELQVWGLASGLDESGRVVNAYFDVVPNDAYRRIVEPHLGKAQPVQIGIEFANGRRMLALGRLHSCVPTVQRGTVLSRFRLEAS